MKKYKGILGGQSRYQCYKLFALDMLPAFEMTTKLFSSQMYTKADHLLYGKNFKSLKYDRFLLNLNIINDVYIAEERFISEVKIASILINYVEGIFNYPPKSLFAKTQVW